MIVTSVGGRLNRADTTLRYIAFFFYFLLIHFFSDIFIVCFHDDQWEILKNESNIFKMLQPSLYPNRFSYNWTVTLVNCFNSLWACFSKVPKLLGSLLRATISVISSQRRGSKPSNFAILLVFLTLKHVKRSAFQNKQIEV